MNITKKLFGATVAVAGLLATAGCSAAGSSEGDGTAPVAGKLSIVAATTPHAEILSHLEESGLLPEVDLEITTLSSGEQGNAAVADGNIDLNYFQHAPYLKEWQGLSGDQSLVSLAPIHIEPLALYSTKYDSLADLPEGAHIVLPNSGTNLSRGLLLLQEHGLITLPEGAGEDNLLEFGIADVVDSPKNLKLSEIDDFLVARALDDREVAAGLISGSIAMEAGLTINENGLVSESSEGNPYANIIVGVAEDAERPEVKELLAALQSEETAAWITETYGDGVVSVTQP